MTSAAAAHTHTHTHAYTPTNAFCASYSMRHGLRGEDYTVSPSSTRDITGKISARGRAAFLRRFARSRRGSKRKRHRPSVSGGCCLLGARRASTTAAAIHTLGGDAGVADGNYGNALRAGRPGRGLRVVEVVVRMRVGSRGFTPVEVVGSLGGAAAHRSRVGGGVGS